MAQLVKNSSSIQETQVQALDWEDPLEEEMAIHSSILAWRIPRTEEPGRLQSMGSQRVRHDWATHTSFFQMLMAESTLTIGISITIKPPSLSPCDTNANDQFSCTKKQTKNPHNYLTTCLTLLPWFSSVALSVLCRHADPGETALKCGIKIPSHTQKIFSIFDA